MPVEVSALMNFLQRVNDDRQRRQQEAAQKPPPVMPKWSKGLDPADFTGTTRELLLRAQAGEDATPQLTSEQLSGMVPFDTRPRQAPASPQRLAPELADTRQRLSPVPAETRRRVVGQEVPAEPVEPPMAAPAPPQAPQQPFNSRRDMTVGEPGDTIRQMQQMQRTGQVPPQHGTVAWRGAEQQAPAGGGVAPMASPAGQPAAAGK